MKSIENQAPQQLPKDDAVKIVSFVPVVVPTPMGGLSQMVWGLGDDNKMYLWDSRKQKWVNG